MLLIQDFDLSSATSFHLPARARWMAEYDSVDQLRSILANPQFATMKRLHIGAGSNLLFTKSFDGLVLHSAMKGMSTVADDGESMIIRAESGIVWDDFVQHCVDNNLYGAENLSYIPGEVGASAVQNIGAYGVEVKDLIVKVEALDTFTAGMVTFTADECKYGYRDSLFKRPDLTGRYIITAVHYRLWHTPRYSLDYGPLKELREVTDLTPAKVRNRVIEIRRSKLPEPSELGSAGSFFKNPVIDKSMWRHIQASYPEAPHYDVDDNLVKVPAGWLIETSGLKGAVEGGAMVYPRQSLVIVNTGNATSDDVVRLYRRVQATVYDRFGIMLSPEVNVI